MLFTDIQNISFEKSLCYIMGYFVAMETYVMLFFIDACFCNVHRIDPITVCTNFEINRYKIALENMQKSYVLFDVT